MSSKLFIQNHQIVQAIVPVDFATGDNQGDYVNMAKYRRCVFIVSTGIGTAGNDIVIDAAQATDASGTGAKALAAITRIDHKVGATAISAVGTFTTVTQTAAASYDSVGIDEAENEALLVIEIDAAALDLANDFTHMRLDVADVGTGAHLGSGIYIMYDPRFIEDPMPTGVD